MPNKLSTASGYVRMSWAPENLYNLYRLSVKEAQPQHLASALSFTRTGLTLYQQKWSSKRLLRAYHGDWIGEKRFKRRFLPSSIPPLQQQQQASTATSLSKGKGRTQEKIPLGSLMWREVEARLDVLVFRACFAHSAYEARRLILHGHVKLNGQTWTDPNILLKPGDIFSVDPREMYLLRTSDRPFETQSKGKSAQNETQEADETPSESAAAAASEQAGTEEATSMGAENVAASEEASSSTPSASEPAKEAKPKANASPSRRQASDVPGLPFNLPDYAAPFLFVPAYLEVSFPTCSAVYVRYPTARPGYSEIPTPYEADGEVMRLGWEYYKGVGRRRRNLSDHGDVEPPSKQESLFDDKGRRIWGKTWDDREMELRRMRGVRMQTGKWTNRPL